ncbi:MAG: phosphoribosyl-AMP cyclohydrolase [Chloroherpetonaceae bacterium]|nr:phosphoribosyl-AMP cyclohydrolase [Chthonomonadaceae bacterium]MDW8207045.1 phosphoribosyl-AMP cyclohydrolase [Chloroherpetonaceae bacterium]
MRVPEELKYNADGLIPAVIQDATNGDVLMVGYMNREAVERTIATGRVTFWSRSRQKFWVKGETSGFTQTVKGIYVDCDQDCLLVRVEQVGAACHEGYRSCFFRQIVENGEALHVIGTPLVDPY